MKLRAAKYLRISQDREGRELGIARQDEHLDELAQRCGYVVVARYSDNDLGASTRSRKRRPDYERMLEAARAGEFDVILAYTSGRLTRRPRELEGQIELAERHGTRFEYVRSPSFDLNTAHGRRIARILAANDAGESEDISERLLDQRRQAASQGRFHGGPRCFGYEADGVTIRPGEAQIVREVARRLLARESLASVVRDLNARGIRTAKGNPWSRKGLKHLMCNARISGRREHIPISSYSGHARPLLGKITGEAVWPPIISVADSDRLRALLTQPARGGLTDGRKYVLSGILKCGLCSSGLVCRPAHGKPRYVCDANSGGCGRISVITEWTDDVVRDMVLVALEDEEFRARLYERAKLDPALVEQIARDEQALEELAQEYSAAGSTLTMGEWRTAREPILARLQANRAKRDLAADTAPIADLDGTYVQMLEVWKRKNTSQRRAAVAAVLVEVKVASASRKFDEDRFYPRWRA
jgi:DNA invertase Pin-like site-specific DNA recombinase